MLRQSRLLQRKAAEDILRKLQAMPEAWTRVDSILEKSQSQQAKFFALQARHSKTAPWGCNTSIHSCRAVQAHVQS